MIQILTAPYDNFAEFTMRATRYRSTIYLEEDFAAKIAQRASEPARPSNPHLPSHAMMTYWGYKFETLSMLPVPPGPQATPAALAARKTTPVSNHAQHCSIIRTQIGSSSLILGGEVDGLSHPKPTPANPDAALPWVELKTAEELPPPSHRQHRDVLKYERKLLKFWAQSFLLGVPKIIVGFRSKHGILRGLDEYDTGRLPGMVRRGTGCWDGSVCVNFAAAFLETLRGWITDEGGVYKIELRKRAGVIEVEKVQEKGTAGIVSEEFLAWRNHTDLHTVQNGAQNKEAEDVEKNADDAPAPQVVEDSSLADDQASRPSAGT